MPPAFATVREAVGVFDDAETLQAATDALLSAGFDRADLSLLASEDTVVEKLGYMYERVSGLEDDGRVPRTAFISTEARGDAEGAVIGGLIYLGALAAIGAVVASGGTIAAAVLTAGAVGGTGGLAGSLIAKWIGDHHAHYIETQLQRGGLLLWVRTRDEDRERRAIEILSRHSAADVHVHDLPLPRIAGARQE